MIVPTDSRCTDVPRGRLTAGLPCWARISRARRSGRRRGSIGSVVAIAGKRRGPVEQRVHPGADREQPLRVLDGGCTDARDQPVELRVALAVDRGLEQARDGRGCAGEVPRDAEVPVAARLPAFGRRPAHAQQLRDDGRLPVEQRDVHAVGAELVGHLLGRPGQSHSGEGGQALGEGGVLRGGGGTRAVSDAGYAGQYPKVVAPAQKGRPTTFPGGPAPPLSAAGRPRCTRPSPKPAGCARRAEFGLGEHRCSGWR